MLKFSKKRIFLLAIAFGMRYTLRRSKGRAVAFHRARKHTQPRSITHFQLITDT